MSLLYCFFIGSTLWLGNYSINPSLERIFRNKPLSPGRKLIFSLLLMLFVSLSIIWIVNWTWISLIWDNDFIPYVVKGSGKWIMIIELSVVLLVALVLYSNEFFHSWREAVKSEEKLKHEKLALQYEALKNQVNPHFLFNSLNTLTSLIGNDDEKATRFVKQLSNIYRYVLEHKDREIVPLETEMQFISNYIDLMKIRFGDNLKVNYDIPKGKQYKVIPLSIQILIENTIKHNIVSSEKPLTIRISINNDDQLVVSNNLQKKSSILKEEDNPWERNGLKNIKLRYEYLSKGRFQVNGSSTEPFPEELNGNFVVNVPLIS